MVSIIPDLIYLKSPDVTQSSPTPLSREFCLNNRVVFYPKSIEEAVFIQDRLKDFGIGWSDGSAVGRYARECADTGMLVENGRLLYNPTADGRNILCTADQFDKEYIPPNQAFLLAQFNKMAERIDALMSRIDGLERKVDQMHEALFPTVENTKPALKRAPRQDI